MLKFGTDGWRAVIAEEFTYHNVRLVSAAIASYLKESATNPSVIIAYDGRFMGREFADAAGREMIRAGIGVVVGDEPCPTPTAAYAVKARGLDGALMFTASHNPYYYNGLKFIPDYAGPATEDITSSIETQLKRLSEERGRTGGAGKGASSKPEAMDLSREYVEHILGFIDTDLIRSRSLSAVADPFHGAGWRLLPEVVGAAGIDVTVIRQSLDPLFGGELPDPSEKSLAPLSAIVREGGHDAGLALDGDGDRFGIIADDGRYLSPNQVAALVLYHMAKNRGLVGAAVRTVATTHMIDEVAADFGLELVETPVGFKHVGLVMRQRAVVMGGEESGGLSVNGHIPEKDGLLADLLIMELIAFEGKPLSEIWRSLVLRYGEFLNRRLDMELSDKQKTGLMKTLTEQPPGRFGGLTVESVSTMDGLRLNLENGAWLLVRPSGTEPIVRLYIEARDSETFAALNSAAEKMTKP